MPNCSIANLSEKPPEFWWYTWGYKVTPQEAGEKWWVFKNVTPPEDEDEPTFWGMLVNPRDPVQVVPLTFCPECGYTLLAGLHFELDTYIWAVRDLCLELM
jgi:hypothetical protein